MYWLKGFVNIDALANNTPGSVAAIGELSNISMFRDPGKEELVIVTFEQDYKSNNLNNQMKKRQYWAREGSTWKIIYEGSA